MTCFETGDVILVKFPFSDLESSKKRPALVLNSVSFHKNLSLITIAMITSKVEVARIEGDLQFQDWSDVGLLYPSLLRLSKIATIENKLVSKKLGRLSPRDLSQVGSSFRKQFADLL